MIKKNNSIKKKIKNKIIKKLKDRIFFIKKHTHTTFIVHLNNERGGKYPNYYSIVVNTILQ